MTGSSEDVCVELVYDSDCPNVDQARANLRGALRALGLSMNWNEWRSDDPMIPEHARRRASPTILVNGRDVGGDEAIDGTASCRLYATRAGMSGAPDVETIVAAIRPHS